MPVCHHGANRWPAVSETGPMHFPTGVEALCNPPMHCGPRPGCRSRASAGRLDTWPFRHFPGKTRRSRISGDAWTAPAASFRHRGCRCDPNTARCRMGWGHASVVGLVRVGAAGRRWPWTAWAGLGDGAHTGKTRRDRSGSGGWLCDGAGDGGGARRWCFFCRKDLSAVPLRGCHRAVAGWFPGWGKARVRRQEAPYAGPSEYLEGTPYLGSPWRWPVLWQKRREAASVPPPALLRRLAHPRPRTSWCPGETRCTHAHAQIPGTCCFRG